MKNKLAIIITWIALGFMLYFNYIGDIKGLISWGFIWISGLIELKKYN